MRISPFSQIFITLAFLTVGIGLVYFFIISPIFTDVKENTGHLIESQRLMLSIERSDQEIQKLRDEVSQAKELEFLLNQTLIKPEEAVDFIIAIENVGKEIGIQYNIGIENPNPAGARLPTVSFQVSLNGSFVDVARFIEGIEKMSQYAQINRFQINRRGDVGNVSATINLWAFSNQ